VAAFCTRAAILSVAGACVSRNFVTRRQNAQVGEKDGGKLELLKVLSAHTQVLPASASGAYAAAAGTG